MPSESGERRTALLHHGGNHPPEPEHLPCPRCESTNTKFCYYNNYNLSQPRHYCKSCRRYWTRGGTLRNVPVGGGTRKNTNKRSRTTTNTATSLSPSCNLSYDPVPTDPITQLPSSKTHMASSLCADVNPNETVPETESYASLLNPNGVGFFTLGGFGVGAAGSVFREMGFGLGAGIWQVQDAGGENNGGGGVSAAHAAFGCNTWQIGGVEGALSDGNCFVWPDLAISTPGEGLK